MGKRQDNEWWAERLVRWTAMASRDGRTDDSELVQLLERSQELVRIVASKSGMAAPDEQLVNDILIGEPASDDKPDGWPGVLFRVGRYFQAGNVTNASAYLWAVVRQALLAQAERAGRVSFGFDVFGSDERAPSDETWVDSKGAHERTFTTIAPSMTPDVSPAALVWHVAKAFLDAAGVLDVLLAMAAAPTPPPQISDLAKQLSDLDLTGERIGRGRSVWRALTEYLQRDVDLREHRLRWTTARACPRDKWARAWQAAYHLHEGDGWADRSEAPRKPQSGHSQYHQQLLRFREAYADACLAAGSTVAAASATTAQPAVNDSAGRRRAVPKRWDPPDHKTLHRRQRPS